MSTETRFANRPRLGGLRKQSFVTRGKKSNAGSHAAAECQKRPLRGRGWEPDLLRTRRRWLRVPIPRV